jgi:hypothetical protein
VIAVTPVDKLHFGGCQIRSRTNYIQLLKLDTGLTRGPEVRVADKDVVKAEGNLFLLQADTTRSVSLGVGIDEKGSLFSGSETGGQIYGRRRFANSTLLVCNCYDSRHNTPS